MESGTGMCRGHDPLFSGQSALPSLPIYHQCAAHVPPHFKFLDKFCIFSLVFGQNFSSHDANFPNFHSQDPLFFKENPLPRPYFWKLVRHTPTKKKVECPPPPPRIKNLLSLVPRADIKIVQLDLLGVAMVFFLFISYLQICFFFFFLFFTLFNHLHLELVGERKHKKTFRQTYTTCPKKN